MLKFFTDTHIAKAVAVQLRSRGVDIVRCEEVGLANATDHQLLEYAAAEGRVMVSQDDDFSTEYYSWLEQGESHNGIMLLPRRLQGEAQISFAVQELWAYYELIRDGIGSIESDFINMLIRL